MRTRFGGLLSNGFGSVCNGLRLAGEAPRLAHEPFGLAGKGLEVACEGLDLARRCRSLALAGELRSRRGGRWGFRATGEAGTHLSLERVQTGTGTDGFQDAIQRQAEDHDVAAESHFRVIRFFGDRGQTGKAGAQLVEVGQISLLGSQVSGGIGGQLARVLASGDERLTAKGFAFVAHLGESAALLHGEVEQLVAEFGFQGGEGSINRGPVRVRDTQRDEVLCHGCVACVGRAIP